MSSKRDGRQRKDEKCFGSGGGGEVEWPQRGEWVRWGHCEWANVVVFCCSRRCCCCCCYSACCCAYQCVMENVPLVLMRRQGRAGREASRSRATARATKSTIRTTKSFTLCPSSAPPPTTLCPHAFGISSTYICQLHWRIRIEIQIRIRVLYANNWTWTVQHAAICGNRSRL